MIVRVSVSCVSDDEFQYLYAGNIDLCVSRKVKAFNDVGCEKFFPVAVDFKDDASLRPAVGVHAIVCGKFAEFFIDIVDVTRGRMGADAGFVKRVLDGEIAPLGKAEGCIGGHIDLAAGVTGGSGDWRDLSQRYGLL